jgi:hypothetical protein
LIDALEEVHLFDGVAGLVLHETETKDGRVAARWARSRNVPVFMITHGANLNRYYTCTAGLEADRAFVYGERGMDAFLDQGVARERLTVTGNPGWDNYAQLRSNKAGAREQLVTAATFQPELPIVVFATTWSAKLSAFGDPTLQERVTRSFFTACARLEAAGVKLNVLVKARPRDRMQQAELRQLADAVGLSTFGFMNGTIDVPLAAADLVVGYDTSAFVSAMLLDVPCINIWGETSWIFGPPYSGYDAIPLVLMDDTQRLADMMRSILFDAAQRSRLTEAAAVRVQTLSLPGEGAAARMAGQIAAALPPVESIWTTIDATGRDRATIGRPVHPALVGNVPEGAHSIFAFDAGGEALGKALAARFPNSTIRCNEAAPEAVRWDATVGAELDAIVLPGTLHRCVRPLTFLESLRAGAPRATVVANVDNLRNLWLARDIVKGTLHYGHDGPLAVDHLHWFTIEELIAVFRDAGYTVRRAEGIPDARKATLNIPPDGGVFDITLPEFVLRGVTAATLDVLTAEAWIVVATP